MIKNIGKIDGIIRVIVGLVLIYFGGIQNISVLSVIMMVVGVILVITAITGSCMVYKLLGISTNKKELTAPIMQQPQQQTQEKI